MAVIRDGKWGGCVLVIIIITIQNFVEMCSFPEYKFYVSLCRYSQTST